jgi:hypothetical protein
VLLTGDIPGEDHDLALLRELGIKPATARHSDEIHAQRHGAAAGTQAIARTAPGRSLKILRFRQILLQLFLTPPENEILNACSPSSFCCQLSLTFIARTT